MKAPPDTVLLQVRAKSSLKLLMKRIKDNFVPNIYELYKIVKKKFSNTDDFSNIQNKEIVSLEIIESNFKKSLNICKKALYCI